MDAPYVELSKYKNLCLGAPNTPHRIAEVSERRTAFKPFNIAVKQGALQIEICRSQPR